MDQRRIVLAIRKLLRERGTGKTTCPSEVARALAPDVWRPLMGAVREAAGVLVDAGEVRCTRHGETVDPRAAHGPIRLARASDPKVSRTDAYRNIDFRAHPEAYRIGRGEEGVLTAEPYKSELLPLWRFRTPEIARVSAQELWAAFVAYRKARDFVGMDMARKYLQMGFTRARRYANHKSGRKYAAAESGKAAENDPILQNEPDAEKAKSAEIFHGVWQKAERDRTYRAWRKRMREGRDRHADETSST